MTELFKKTIHCSLPDITGVKGGCGTGLQISRGKEGPFVSFLVNVDTVSDSNKDVNEGLSILKIVLFIVD